MSGLNSASDPLFEGSNIIKERCPACGKQLRFKPPCCADKTSYLVCPCGYKKAKT